MSFGTFWIQILLTIFLLDFAARLLPGRWERWIFYATIVTLLIGEFLKVMHWPFGGKFLLYSLLAQFVLFLLSLRITVNRKPLHWLILLWLASCVLRQLFFSRLLAGRYYIDIASSILFLIYTTWCFYLLLLKSSSKKLR